MSETEHTTQAEAAMNDAVTSIKATREDESVEQDLVTGEPDLVTSDPDLSTSESADVSDDELDQPDARG